LRGVEGCGENGMKSKGRDLKMIWNGSDFKEGLRCQEELEIDQEWIIEGLTADQIRNLVTMDDR
jgi:hypothetical protein